MNMPILRSHRGYYLGILGVGLLRRRIRGQVNDSAEIRLGVDITI